MNIQYRKNRINKGISKELVVLLMNLKSYECSGFSLSLIEKPSDTHYYLILDGSDVTVSDTVETLCSFF